MITMTIPAQVQIDATSAPQVNGATDQTRKWALRGTGCWLGGQLAQVFGSDWDLHLGIDPNRASQWSFSRLAEGTSIPSPRETLAMAYALGLEPGLTFKAMVGTVDLMTEKPDVDSAGAGKRCNRLIRRVQFPEKAYRGAEVEDVLERLSARYTSTEARRYLAQRMGVSESMLGQILRSNVAASSWSDAALALEMGRPLATHWRLGGVLTDLDWLKALDKSHREEGKIRRGLVGMAFESIDELRISRDDIENSFMILPMKSQLTLREALAFKQLDETLVLESQGEQWSLQVVMGQVDRILAAEAGVDDSPWFEFRLYALDRDGWVTGAKKDGRPADWETLTGAVSKLLPEGLETKVFGLKLQIPDVKRYAVGFEKKVVSLR